MNEQPVAPAPTPTPAPELPNEDDSLEVMGTGSLFKTETKVEIDDKAHFKLDTGKYLKQALVIIVVIAILIILAAVLLFKTDIDGAASLSSHLA